MGNERTWEVAFFNVFLSYFGQLAKMNNEIKNQMLIERNYHLWLEKVNGKEGLTTHLIRWWFDVLT